MMQIFNKYQSAGNDFIIIDNRDNYFDSENVEFINKYDGRCTSHFTHRHGIVNNIQLLTAPNVERGSKLYFRTLERNVEGETLACDTSITTSAIASALSRHFDSRSIDIKTKWSELNGKFTNVWLSCPATFVFEGIIKI